MHYLLFISRVPMAASSSSSSALIYSDKKVRNSLTHQATAPRGRVQFVSAHMTLGLAENERVRWQYQPFIDKHLLISQAFPFQASSRSRWRTSNAH